MKSISDGFDHAPGLAERLGSYQMAGSFPAAFVLRCDNLKELSVFVDESGDFGIYQPHSPFYLVMLVFHDQSFDISRNISRLRDATKKYGISDYTIHAGPLIRREEEYKEFTLHDRKRVFDILFHFVRTSDITYHCVIAEKKQLAERIDLNVRISKQLSAFLFQHLETLMSYDRITVYYDYGQMELTNILVSVFSAVLPSVEFRKVSPADYKLFQAADMLCTLELLSLKAESKTLSKSELTFFSSPHDLKKSYLKALRRKRFS